MKKFVVLSSVVMFVGFLISCKNPEVSSYETSVVTKTDVNVDTNRYNQYTVYHVLESDTLTQNHFIPSSWDIYEWSKNPDLGKVVKVDTIRVNVLWSDK